MIYLHLATGEVTRVSPRILKSTKGMQVFSDLANIRGNRKIFGILSQLGGGCLIQSHLFLREKTRDGLPALRGVGGSPPRPAPPRSALRGEGGFSALPHPAKLITASGKWRGKGQGHILKPFQNRKLMMEQYCNTKNAQSSL